MEDVLYNINKSKCLTIQDGFKKLCYRDFPGSPVVSAVHSLQGPSKQIQGCPLLQLPTTLQLFPRSNLQIQPLSCLWSPGLANTIFFSKLNCLLPINHGLPDLSELFHWDADHHLCTSWPPTYPSLGFSFDLNDVALEGRGHFFLKLAKGEHDCLLKMQTVRRQDPLPEHA